ncbi:hypothetical protein DVH24_017973, partial [Malus domestica]
IVPQLHVLQWEKNDYKVVRLVRVLLPHENVILEVEVYCLRSYAWRRIIVMPSFSNTVISWQSKCTFFDGVVYWIIMEYSRTSILAFVLGIGTVECYPRVDNRDFFSAFPFLFVFLSHNSQPLSVSNLAFFGSQIGFSRSPTSHELQTRCFLTGKTTEPAQLSSVLQFDSNNFFTQKLAFPGEFYSFLVWAEEDDENISGELYSSLIRGRTVEHLLTKDLIEQQVHQPYISTTTVRGLSVTRAILRVAILPATKRKVIEKIWREGPPKLLWPAEAVSPVLDHSTGRWF